MEELLAELERRDVDFAADEVGKKKSTGCDIGSERSGRKTSNRR
jgi:hypothetical protein